MPKSRPCGTCGETVHRKGDRGNAPAYCDKPDCYKRCAVDECDAPTRATYCNRHGYRFKRYGDPRFVTRHHVSNVGLECGVDNCERPAVTKGYCDPHYKKLHRHGDPLGGLHDNSGSCQLPDCETQASSRGWCRKHYSRWVTYGDPLALDKLKQFRATDPDKPTCAIQDCGRRTVGQGYCKRHYYRLMRYGDPFGGPDVDIRHCKLCARQVEPGLYKDYCSNACYWAVRNNGPSVPTGAACSTCGVWMDFLFDDASGRRRYQSRRWCWDCYLRVRSAPNAMTVDELERRDGNDCSLCREPIDMSIRDKGHPNYWMRPSVDHVTPLSWGGLNVPENVALAHLICNMRKNDHSETLAN